MGLCHEFGSQIRNGCNHPMRAGATACSCAECGVVCRGLFDGCPDVWARGPRPVTISATRAGAGTTNGAPAAVAVAPDPRPEPARTTGTGVDRDGARRDGTGARARSDSDTGARARGGDVMGGGDAVIAYLEAAPVAIGPGIVGRPGADTRSESRIGGERAGAGSGAGRADDPSAKADARETPGDPRRDLFRWFEEAFEGVRLELQALIGSMTHQQAMLAELLDSRQAELRLALVAESLPDLVADAVQSAMNEHTATLAESFDRSHERFRDEVDQIRIETGATVDVLSESFQRLSSAIAVHDEEAEQREAVRLGALKGSVTRQITPLADALAGLAATIEALGERIGDSGRSAPSPAATPSRAAAPAAAPVLKGLGASRGASKATPPAVGRRVSIPRVKAADVEVDQPAVTPRRVVTARGSASASAAGVPGSVANGTAAAPVARPVARPVTRPVATGRVATGRVATAAPAPRSPASARPASATAQVTPARVATGRVATARVAAAKASDALTDEPTTAPIGRVLNRRKATAPPVPDEPVVVYELESEDDADADWVPPAWVSAAARERAANPAARAGTRGRSTRTPT